MERTVRFLDRIPRLVLGVLVVLAISAAGLLPVTVLDDIGVRISPRVPWQAPIALLWMGLAWWYLDRPGWRREHLGAGRVPWRSFSGGLTALVAGTAAIHAFRMAALRAFALSDVTVPDVSSYSIAVLLSSFFITAVAAGLFEEAAYRGYLQRILFERHGPFAAITLSALVFATAHLSRGSEYDAALPFAFVFGCFYGFIAWKTGTIVPGVIVHSTYNVARFLELWLVPQPVLSATALLEVGAILAVTAAWLTHRAVARVPPAAASS
jgi:membrane protease YdiL (CAAX protease family)